MPKKIVICCDGTGNTFENVNEESNVAKLYCSLDVNAGQRCYYHPGVGTMGSPNSRGPVGRTWSKLKGLAFGSGLLANVGDAYQFLMNTYDDGDEIYLFGFSRGAFTARALASLIHVYGLLCPGNQGAIPYILQMYAKNSRAANHQKRTFDADDAFKWQFSHAEDVKIKFCGLWDTVSSYGWIYDPILLPFLGCNPIIEVGRHAISIHERRCFYRDNLWGSPNPGQDIRQVWFAGVHSDVGGSYPEPTAGLSKIALEWMLVEATAAGLGIHADRARVMLGTVRPDPEIKDLPQFVRVNSSEKPHDSLHGPWWLLEVMPQRDPHLHGRGWWLPLGHPRDVPAGSLIHASVIAGKQTIPPVEGMRIEPWVRF